MEKNIKDNSENKTKGLVELLVIKKVYGDKIADMCIAKYPELVEQGKMLAMFDSKFGKLHNSGVLKTEVASKRVDRFIAHRLNKQKLEEKELQK